MKIVPYCPLPGCPSQWPCPLPSATSGHAHSEVLGPMDSGSHLGVRHKRLEPTTDHLVSVFPFFGPLNFKPTLCVRSKLRFQGVSTNKGLCGQFSLYPQLGTTIWSFQHHSKTSLSASRIMCFDYISPVKIHLELRQPFTGLINVVLVSSI